MIDPAQLSQTAHDNCLQHVTSLFEGEYAVQVLGNQTNWNPRELRQMFEQAMTVWRKYGEFEVILDEHDTPVGYIDHDKWTGCKWRELTPEQIKAIVSPYDPARADLTLHDIRRGDRDCVEVRVKVGNEAEFFARINPERLALIAFVPVGSVVP